MWNDNLTRLPNKKQATSAPKLSSSLKSFLQNTSQQQPPKFWTSAKTSGLILRAYGGDAPKRLHSQYFAKIGHKKGHFHPKNGQNRFPIRGRAPMFSIFLDSKQGPGK
jgi:hypothetical protein